MKTTGDPVLCLPPEEDEGKPCVGYVTTFIILLTQLLISEGTRVRVLSKDKTIISLSRLLCLAGDDEPPAAGANRPLHFKNPWGNLQGLLDGKKMKKGGYEAFEGLGSVRGSIGTITARCLDFNPEKVMVVNVTG